MYKTASSELGAGLGDQKGLRNCSGPLFDRKPWLCILAFSWLLTKAIIYLESHSSITFDLWICEFLFPHQVQRNCCLTLCNFSIPEELEFQYSRVNQLLLKILEPARQDESIQRIAVHLCNALVCQVDNHHKEAVGKMGFVRVKKPWKVLDKFPP